MNWQTKPMRPLGGRAVFNPLFANDFKIYPPGLSGRSGSQAPGRAFAKPSPALRGRLSQGGA